MEQVKAAIADLSNNVSALIAAKTGAPSTGITPEEAAAIADGLTTITNRIKAVLPPA